MRIVLLITALILAASCNRRQPRVVAPPAVAAPPVQPPVTLGPPAPPVSAAQPASTTAIENASREFARADPQAAENYQQYLALVPAGGRRDEALFHLGLIFSQPGDPRQDWQRAMNWFNQVVNEFPASPFKPAAQLIMTLKSETVQLAAESETRNQRIRQLNAELDRLIRIDSERRSR